MNKWNTFTFITIYCVCEISEKYGGYDAIRRNIHRLIHNSFILCTKSAKNELNCEEIEDIINTENKFERKYHSKGEYK